MVRWYDIWQSWQRQPNYIYKEKMYDRRKMLRFFKVSEYKSMEIVRFQSNQSTWATAIKT